MHFFFPVLAAPKIWTFYNLRNVIGELEHFHFLSDAWNHDCALSLTIPCVCLVTQLCPTLCDPMDCSPPGSSVHGDSPGKNTGGGWLCSPPGDLPNPGIEPRSPALKADSLPTEPQGRLDILWLSSLMLILCDPMHCDLLDSSVHGIP